jgi:hypothetical protein
MAAAPRVALRALPALCGPRQSTFGAASARPLLAARMLAARMLAAAIPLRTSSAPATPAPRTRRGADVPWRAVRNRRGAPGAGRTSVS